MSPLLSVRGLTKHYGALVAVDGVDFEVQPGEVHAVIGPNGAGKSTFVAMLAGETRPSAGSIAFDDVAVTHLPAAARARRGMARSFQITSIVGDCSVLENAVLAALAATGQGFGMAGRVMDDAALLDNARALLARVGLDHAHDHRIAADLAHGAQRQLELAMALAGRPRLLLLDEPTAGTGPEEARAMVDLLLSIKHGADAPAIILVEHDLEAIFALADRITVLALGRVIACEVPDIVRADAAVRAAYLGDDA